MSVADVEAHQRRHGFIAPIVADAAEVLTKLKGKRRAPNGTETAYGRILESQKARGEIIHFVYEGITLHWGDTMRYTPDYVVFIDDMPIKLIEIKGGFIRPKDLIRFKGCKAEWKTWFDFELWQKDKSGQWSRIL